MHQNQVPKCLTFKETILADLSDNLMKVTGFILAISFFGYQQHIGVAKPGQVSFMTSKVELGPILETLSFIIERNNTQELLRTDQPSIFMSSHFPNIFLTDTFYCNFCY